MTIGIVNERNLPIFIYATLKDRRIREQALGENDNRPLHRATATGLREAMIDRNGTEWPTLKPTHSHEGLEGQIMYVDEAELKRLDKWESHYMRIIVMTTRGDAFAYVLKPAKEAVA